jgi:hypothetical protein
MPDITAMRPVAIVQYRARAEAHTGRAEEHRMNPSDPAATKAELDRLMIAFFRAVSFEPGGTPAYDSIHALFIAQGLLIKSTPFAPEICTLAQFIEPRRAMVLSAELTRFHEAEEGETTQVFGHVAQRFSAYVKSGTTKGVAFKARGMICTQFVRMPDGWKMSAMAWDDERPGLAMASQYDS